MQKRTRSILEELEDMHRERDVGHIVETRATNLIAGAIRLIDLIEDTYSPEEAEKLTKKLTNAIRLKDSGKFTRSLRKINESK